jgi:hypothetical protein
MSAAWDLGNFPKVHPQPHKPCRIAKTLQGCWNMTNVNFFTSSVNTLLDVVIFALPIPAIYKLQTTLGKKGTSSG